MISIIADNITSPLGFTTYDNLTAVIRGATRLRRYEGRWGLPEPFTASLFDEDEVESAFAERIGSDKAYTRFEQMAIISADDAIRRSGLDPASPHVQFIIATTKANVALLEHHHNHIPDNRLMYGEAARAIAQHFGNKREPIVVSNACISGVCAQIEAIRSIESGACEHAVVIGADEQSPFIVSGFQSFKALSPEPCRPFDIERIGLNLGEAAATMVVASPLTPLPKSLTPSPSPKGEGSEYLKGAGSKGQGAGDDSAYVGAVPPCQNSWTILCGAIRNDAHHISSPSPTGEGSYRVLRHLLDNCACHDDLALINAHGTGTLYNDEMEAKAIFRAGLSAIPVNALKGYYGHTMGAAGILESILTMHALDQHTIIGTYGFDESGVSKPVNISPRHRITSRHAFIKLISGFGGTNAGILFDKTHIHIQKGDETS